MNGNPISSTAISVQMAYQYYIENHYCPLKMDKVKN